MYLQYLLSDLPPPFHFDGAHRRGSRPTQSLELSRVTAAEGANRPVCYWSYLVLTVPTTIPYPHSYQGWYEKYPVCPHPLMGSAQNDQPSISKQHSLFTARGEKIKWIPDSGTWENLPLPLQTISPSPNKRLSLLQIVASCRKKVFSYCCRCKQVHTCNVVKKRPFFPYLSAQELESSWDNRRRHSRHHHHRTARA